jgi:hypothetical protein
VTTAACSAGPAEIGSSADASGIDVTATLSGAAPPGSGCPAAAPAAGAASVRAALRSSSGISMLIFMIVPYATIA